MTGICLPVAPELAAFYAHLLSQEGWPYIWPVEANGYSGKGLEGSKYPLGRDCSGAVTWAIWMAGGPDWRALKSTRHLWGELHEVGQAQALPGDFALYADVAGRINHVMTLTEDGRVFGADGPGPSCLTPADGERLDAKVRFRPFTYRKPAGFRVNPLRKVEASA